jgi:flagellar protein FlgJ
MKELNLDTKLRGQSVASESAIQPADDPAATPEYRAKVQKAAEKFEGFFIAQMLREMRESTRQMSDDDSVYNNRVNQDMLDMADVAMADSLSGQRAFGIADAILRQLLPPTAPERAAETAALKNSPKPVASSD